MVGVPRSKGCRRCVEKRIKCDETRPVCRECERRKLACPGYPEKFRFCNRHVENGLESHRRNKYTVSYRRPGGSADTLTSMDGKVAPNLLRESLHSQHLETFSQYIIANFPCFQACYGPRVDVTWMDFLFSPVHSPPDSLRLAIRCVSTFHLGQTQKDLFEITNSQRVYQDVLASVRMALANDSGISHYTLAATFILATYEMKNQGLWLLHTNAIAAMMQLYPPTAFMSGFGRTLFLTLRPFLIRAAFAQNQACFLGNGDWVTMVESTIRSEYDNGNGSLLGELIETAFSEVTKIPGLVARTRSLRTELNYPPCLENTTLMDAIVQCKNRLRVTQEQILHVLVDLRDPTVNFTAMHHYLGPMSICAADNLAQGCLDGIRSALMLLDDVAHQAAHHLVQEERMGSTIYGDDIDRGFYPVSAQSYDVSAEVGWLDRCALALGVVPSH